jgi:hypothetical protein
VCASAYVEARGVLLDRQGFEGLLSWMVVLWVLPVAALLVLILSAIRHRNDYKNGGI